MIIQAKKVILAPMEGVADALMRHLLTSVNSYDFCIAEFMRVVDCLIPEHVFYRIFPELQQQSYTPSKTPLRLQLLGQEPHWMAENAVRAIELGSHGIDLNFCCPAKAVNKSRGGAVLLKQPEEIYKIVSAVKNAVGSDVVVSAKIRLGFDNVSLLDEIVSAITSANANQLTIHARTKVDGYRPPAYWRFIADIKNRYAIEIFANGEIWNKDDAQRCMLESKTTNLMLGRGALALPNLANVIKFDEAPFTWAQMQTLFIQYAELELMGSKSFYFSSRLKQWLRYLRLAFPEAELLFNEIKLMKDKDEILTLIKRKPS
jgi:tRNA-dihydrouridine synthase C